MNFIHGWRGALLAIGALSVAAGCDKSGGGGGDEPSLQTETEERAAVVEDRAADLESAVSSIDAALLDAPLPLPAQVWIDGTLVPVPTPSTPPTINLLEVELAALLDSIAAVGLEDATDAELQPLIADGRALEILLRGAAAELASNGAPPPYEALRSSQVVYGLAATGGLVGTISFALEHHAYFEGAPPEAAAVAEVHEKMNDATSALAAIPGVIEDSVNESAVIGGDLSDQATVAADASAQATADNLLSVASAIDAYAAAIDGQPYFDRSTALEGYELTFVNVTLPAATEAELQELYEKLALLDPNSSPTVHEELQTLVTEIRLAYIEASYSSLTSSLPGLDGFLADLAVHLAPIPGVSDAMVAAKGSLDAALVGETPGPELATLIATLDSGHDAVIVQMSAFDVSMATEGPAVAALGETLKQSLDDSVDAAEDL